MTNIVFTTVVNCDLRGQRSVQLNDGTAIQVLGPCLASVGSATPPEPFAVRPTVAVSIQSANLGPEARLDARVCISPNQVIIRHWARVVRPGPAIDFRLDIRNESAEPVQNVSFGFVLPPEVIPAGVPPFIPPTHPGATYEPGTRRIAWTGDLDPDVTITITFRADVSAAGRCPFPVVFDLTTPVCTASLRTDWLAASVPPSEGHLIGVTGRRDPQGPPVPAQLWTLRPGIDPLPQPLLCWDAGAVYGIGAGADGDIRVAGEPTFRCIPRTLHLLGLTRETIVELQGMSESGRIEDVVVPPVEFPPWSGSGSTPVFGGWRYGGTSLWGWITRYDAAGPRRWPHFLSTSQSDLHRLAVDPDGAFVTLVRPSYVTRVLATAPTYYTTVSQQLSDPGFSMPNSLALDTDGHYIVSSSAAAKKLVKINRQTTAFATLVDNLYTLLPSPDPAGYPESAVGPNGDIFLGGAGGGLWVIHRGPPPSAEQLFTAGAGIAHDLEYVVAAGGGSLRGDSNCDGTVNMTDIPCFAEALLDPTGARWTACRVNPNCTYVGVNDLNGDGQFSRPDIEPFVRCVINQPPTGQACP